MDKQGWFDACLTEYQQDYDPLLGIYREARGILIEPHRSGEGEVPLGTREVEGYRIPDYWYDKILYCEKEGFNPDLR